MLGCWQSLTGGSQSPQAQPCITHLPATRAMPPELQCCSRPGHGLSCRQLECPHTASDLPQCHRAGTAGVALGLLWWHFPGKASAGEKGGAGSRGSTVAARHDFTGRLWTLPWESPAVPHATLECCQQCRAAGQPGAGRGATPAQPVASQLAPAWLCHPAGTCLALTMDLLRCWQGHVPMRGSWGWAGGMRSLLLCHLLAQPGSFLCFTGRARCWQRSGDAEAGALWFPGQRGDLHQPAGGPLVGEHSPQARRPLQGCPPAGRDGWVVGWVDRWTVRWGSEWVDG